MSNANLCARYVKEGFTMKDNGIVYDSRGLGICDSLGQGREDVAPPPLKSDEIINQLSNNSDTSFYKETIPQLQKEIFESVVAPLEEGTGKLGLNHGGIHGAAMDNLTNWFIFGGIAVLLVIIISFFMARRTRIKHKRELELLHARYDSRDSLFMEQIKLNALLSSNNTETIAAREQNIEQLKMELAQIQAQTEMDKNK